MFGFVERYTLEESITKNTTTLPFAAYRVRIRILRSDYAHLATGLFATIVDFMPRTAIPCRTTVR